MEKRSEGSVGAGAVERRLNGARVPAWALALQGAWSCLLVQPRTYDPATHAYGNLYSNLLDYAVSAALLFYVLTLLGLFRLRKTRPDAPRPYRAVGYPVVPAAYIGIVIVALGAPVYLLRRRSNPGSASAEGR